MRSENPRLFRRALAIRMRGMADAASGETFLGIEIGGTKLQIVAGDATGRIARRWRADADRAGGGSAIRGQLIQGIGELRGAADVAAIGVGFGGPVDHLTGRIARSHQVEGWEGFPIRDWVSEQTGLPAAVENDSNLAAFAEAQRGAGRSSGTVFYFNLGSGVGGGLVIGGEIYHGRPPGEAEFGHLLLERTGATVESRCSGWAIDARVRGVRTTHPDSVLARELPELQGGDSRLLAGALAQNDRAAREIVDALADDLGFALSHVVHLFHPTVIVLGGGLSLLGEPLRGAVEEALAKYVMKAFLPAPQLLLARLGEDAVPVGALLLAARQVSGSGALDTRGAGTG